MSHTKIPTIGATYGSSKLNFSLWFMYLSAFWLFTTGFFLFPSAKAQDSFFYYALIPLFALNIQQVHWRALLGNVNFLPVICYLAYSLLSCFWSAHFSWSGFFDVALHIAYLLGLYMMLSLVLQLPKLALQRLIHAFIMIAAVSAALSIVVWYAYNPFNTRLFGLFRATHPILADWAYGVPMIIYFHQFIVQKEIKNALIALIAVIPLLAFILLTQSRGPIVALGAVLTIMAFTIRNKRSFACLAILLLAVLANLPMLARIEMTFPYRAYIWSTVFKNSLSHLWFGAGYLADKTVVVNSLNMVFTHAHNIYLEEFFFGGIVGLALLLWMLIKPLFIIAKNQQNPIYFVTGMVFIYGLVCVFTDGSRIITNPHELWLCLWMPLFLLILLLPKLTLLVRPS